jgi:hypothetical protein
MVGNRPVVGVRNPVRSTSSLSYLRAKNAGTGSPESGKPHQRKPDPGNHHLIGAMTSEPSPAAGGGAIILNEKKY